MTTDAESGPLDEGMSMLVVGTLAQLEEVIADVRKNADVYLKSPTWKPSHGLRGPFTESVQSIYSGAIDAKEACRMLGGELAPFVDGPALATTLASVTKEVTDADNLYGEIVDSFVIRAMNDLGRGVLALALDRPQDFPATCETFRALLEGEVPNVKKLLAG